MTLAHGGGLSASRLEEYFDQELSQDDYFSEHHQVVGKWLGKGAEALSLGDEVKREDFTALLKGINPHDGTVLIESHNGKRLAGWEAQFSVPKSVSLQAVLADPRLIHAHEESLQVALTEVEKYALSRMHGGQEWVVSGNVVAAKFTHLSARPANNGLVDPNLHSHVIFINATERPDGLWRALDSHELYRSQQYGSAVYLSELAHCVQELGYRIEYTGAKLNAWELQGYSQEHVKAFSNRSADMDAKMAEWGATSARAAQKAAIITRNPKSAKDEMTLKAEWQQRAAALGIDAPALHQQAISHGPVQHLASPGTVEHAVQFAYQHATEHEAQVDRRALEIAALRHGMGAMRLDQVRDQIDLEMQRGLLIQNRPADYQHPEGIFTTAEMFRLETENLTMRREGVGKALPIATAPEVQKWASQRGLFADQAAAAELALTSPDWLTAIEGLAGTTKTTTCAAISEYAEARGYAVSGFSMQSGAVNELKKVGIEARTIASLTNNPVPNSDKPRLWIIDESSLLATKPVNEVLRLARHHGIERVALVGDQRQHLAIEAGHPMRQFLEDGMPVAELTKIMRQRDPELREVVIQASQGKAGAAARAIDLLDEQGRLHQVEDPKERYQRIAEAYLRGHELEKTTLVVSPGNDERREINRTIRQQMIDAGHVRDKGIRHDILVPRQDMTKSSIGYARYYDPGDVIHFHRAHKKQGIARDAYLTVQSVDRAGNLLTLQYSNGRTIEVSPARWGKSIQVYTQERREIAVGDRIEYRIHDHKRHIANHQLATVTSLDGKDATLKFDDGRTVKGPLSPHLDYGYCSTSYGAQGTTVDRVIINLDSMRGPQLVNQRSFYVTSSRARDDVRLYTDDAEAVRNAVKREQKKEMALEIVPQHQLRHSTGMRI
jgi:conjugative relaxase-like TrwC/TraI family protein